MQSGSLDVGGCEIKYFEASAEDISGDDFLVIQLPDRIRLAVFDGVSDSGSTDFPLSGGSDAFASGVLRMTFKSNEPLLTLAHKANKYLNSFPAKRTRDKPQSTAMVADLYRNKIEVLRSGDCEMWIKENGNYYNLFPLPMVYEDQWKKYKRWVAKNLNATKETHIDMQEQFLGDSKYWRAAAIGRFKDLNIESKSITAKWEEIILASDGAFLDSTSLLCGKKHSEQKEGCFF